MDEITELTRKRDQERTRLETAISQFAEAMWARTGQKVDEGYVGWDELGWDIEARLWMQVSKLANAATPEEKERRAIDLGAFAFFAWWRAQNADKSRELGV